MVLAFGLAIIWAFEPGLARMVARWSTDPRYSHGFLVPVFAAWRLCERRAEWPVGPTSPWAAWAGVVLVAIAAGMSMAAGRAFYPWLEAAALIPALGGLALLLGGWRGLSLSGPSLAFLVFMLPLPYRVETRLGAPLQGVATACGTFALQTLGFPAHAEGFVITINRSRIGVVEACNGLGMLLTFTALATGFAMVVNRSWLDRIVIVLSAVPIAVAANVTRITATGLLRELASERIADAVYHDLAGWLMMPLALAWLGIELWLLDKVFVVAATPAALPISGSDVRSGGRRL